MPDDAGDDTGWPVDLRGVIESVAATRGPDGAWNVAALGLHPGDPVTARTFGDTRTRRNFAREGGGVVQFVTDPRDFVDAALSVREEPEPVLDSAAAWVEVAAEQVGSEERGGAPGREGTTVREWALEPTAVEVRERRVPTIERGFAAVVDATVAASRLDVPGYDEATLLDRLAYFESVVESCGGPRDREAFERIDEYAGWRSRRE